MHTRESLDGRQEESRDFLLLLLLLSLTLACDTNRDRCNVEGATDHGSLARSSESPPVSMLYVKKAELANVRYAGVLYQQINLLEADVVIVSNVISTHTLQYHLSFNSRE